MPEPLQQVLPLWRSGAAASAATAEPVATEVPVALSVNGISQAVMLATPTDLEDFAWGFARAEGWIERPQELLDVEVQPHADGLVLELRVLAVAEQRIKARRRERAGVTGCGLCGIGSLDQLPHLQPRVGPAADLSPAALLRGMQALPLAQPLNQACGGVHGAAWCSAEGELLSVREDIGRHNALDKLCGALWREAGSAPGWVAMSSRASFELVHKAVLAGALGLASISAPSSLAIQAARQAGLPLWAFVREGRATRYA